MALIKYESQPYSITDVISHELTGFSRKVITVNLAQDVEPGSVIDNAGAIVTSASTSANVVLEYKEAGNAVHVLCAATNVWLKKFSLKCDDVEKAVELLSADPAVRFSDADVNGLPTT